MNTTGRGGRGRGAWGSTRKEWVSGTVEAGANAVRVVSKAVLVGSEASGVVCGGV